MYYTFSLPNPTDRFINIELTVNGKFNNSTVELQLPSWRPGRYELGNFAKNIKGFRSTGEEGKSLSYTKVTKDRWRIAGVNGTQLKVSYRYFASQPDAGACWADSDVMYVNPVHCCMFVPGREQEPCIVNIEVPENWKIATGLTSVEGRTFSAPDFDRLADSPFIASASLSHAGFTYQEVDFNIWIQGECRPDWPRIIRDFEGFAKVQLDMMKEFPAKDFHFLILVLPTSFYHGVEHLNSTVLALGPGINLMNETMYIELLGVASHELFHCWNVKTIRPQEMLPYDFTRENYSDAGYVYEGVTTYYGDLFLARSGFFNLQQLLKEYSARFQKHMDNPGRMNYSVAQSSFDTWLDGYVPGIPGRKTSIYDEGCLIAWMLDFMIRSSTDNAKSLDDVMRFLYFDVAKKGNGYAGSDFQKVIESVAGRSFWNFFEEYVYSPVSFHSMLSELVSLAGLSVSQTPTKDQAKSKLGIRTDYQDHSVKIISVHPDSPGAESGLLKDDEILAINGIRVQNNLSDLVAYCSSGSGQLELLVSSQMKVRAKNLVLNGKSFYDTWTITANEQVTHSQLQFRQSWLAS